MDGDICEANFEEFGEVGRMESATKRVQKRWNFNVASKVLDKTLTALPCLLFFFFFGFTFLPISSR